MRKPKHPARFGHGATLAAIVADRWLDTDWATALIALGAVIFYVWGAWSWAGQFGPIGQRKRETSVRLQVAVSGLLAVSLLLALALVYLLRRPELTTEQIATLERYRGFYENSDAPNKTGLIEFTNGELRTRTQNAYTRIRAMTNHYKQEQEKLQLARNRKEITQQEMSERHMALMQQLGREFENNYRVEALMLLRELRNRIPFEARKHIPATPFSDLEIKPADSRAGAVNLLDVVPSMGVAVIGGFLANELEELSKLLAER